MLNFEEQKQRTNQNVKENIIMKKWIKADNGRVTQVIEFDDGSKIELPLDNNGNLKWFDDSKLIKKAS